MTTITAQHILGLWAAVGFDRAVLTDHDDAVSIVERLTARHAGWPVLAYQVDLVEQFPGGMTTEQAQAWADQINSDRAAALGAAESATE